MMLTIKVKMPQLWLSCCWPHVTSIGIHLCIGKPNILHRTSVYFLEEEQKFGSHLSNVHLFKKQTYLFRNKIYANPDIT